jgi:threonine/homoserine/homoserine lactone efflux protein
MPDPLLAAVRWGSVGALVVSSTAIMGSPGPATISLTAAGSAFGVRRCFRYLFGVIAGTGAVLAAVATGITAALLAVPALRVVLIVVSAAYILWLAYRVATAPPLAATTDTADAPTLAGGLLIGIANPKAWVAIAAVFASTRLAAGATADALAKLVVLTAMIMLICTIWLLLGASLARSLRDPRTSRIVNVGLAVAWWPSPSPRPFTELLGDRSGSRVPQREPETSSPWNHSPVGSKPREREKSAGPPGQTDVMRSVAPGLSRTSSITDAMATVPYPSL